MALEHPIRQKPPDGAGNAHQTVKPDLGQVTPPLSFQKTLSEAEVLRLERGELLDSLAEQAVMGRLNESVLAALERNKIPASADRYEAQRNRELAEARRYQLLSYREQIAEDISSGRLKPGEVREEESAGISVKTIMTVPDNDSWAANATADHRVMYINGMCMELDEIRESGQVLSNTLGCPVVVIVNEKEKNLKTEVMHAIKGVLSLNLGFEAEPGVVTRAAAQGIKEIESGRELTIFCYSQGAIISQNALELMKDSLSPLPWKDYLEKIKVRAIGAELYNWPKGLDVEHLILHHDPIPKIMGTGSDIRSRFLEDLEERELKDLGRSQVRARTNVLPEGGHTSTKYFNRYHEFIINQFSDKKGIVNGPALASRLAADIRHGAVSDRVANRVAEVALEHGIKGFASALLAEKDASGLGKFSFPEGLLLKLQSEIESGADSEAQGKTWRTGSGDNVRKSRAEHYSKNARR